MKISATFFFLFLLLAPVSIAQDTVQSGKASFYHDSFHGQETSNGESYDKNDFTAAHRTLPFGTILLVTNKKNKKTVIVRVNDRGPFAKSRVIDLSRAAAIKIGMIPFGVVPVRMTVLNTLNLLPFSDSTFHDGDIWDCTGKKRELSSNTIYVWKTENWKHAFYMASSLSIENKTDVFVKVERKNEATFYSLLITTLEKTKVDELKKKLQKEGFKVRVK